MWGQVSNPVLNLQTVLIMTPVRVVILGQESQWKQAGTRLEFPPGIGLV